MSASQNTVSFPGSFPTQPPNPFIPVAPGMATLRFVFWLSNNKSCKRWNPNMFYNQPFYCFRFSISQRAKWTWITFWFEWSTWSNDTSDICQPDQTITLGKASISSSETSNQKYDATNQRIKRCLVCKRCSSFLYRKWRIPCQRKRKELLSGLKAYIFESEEINLKSALSQDPIEELKGAPSQDENLAPPTITSNNCGATSPLEEEDNNSCNSIPNAESITDEAQKNLLSGQVRIKRKQKVPLKLKDS